MTYDPYKVQHKQTRASERLDRTRDPLCGFDPADDPKRPSYSLPFFMHDQWKMVTCPKCLALGKRKARP
jgi:hypothetical protein